MEFEFIEDAGIEAIRHDPALRSSFLEALLLLEDVCASLGVQHGQPMFEAESVLEKTLPELERLFPAHTGIHQTLQKNRLGLENLYEEAEQAEGLSVKSSLRTAVQNFYEDLLRQYAVVVQMSAPTAPVAHA